MITKVKICGITIPEDGVAAVDAGADAIGLVFYRGSKRAVGVEQGLAISQAVGPFVTTVGLFVNEQPRVVEAVYRQVGLHLVQLHGDESDEYIESLGLPVIRVIRVRDQQDLSVSDERFRKSTVLLDSYSPDERGGSGKVFAWDKAKKLADAGISFYLAGGLTPENVRDAMMISGASGVDVSSGVESNGLKDLSKIKHFIDQAKK